MKARHSGETTSPSHSDNTRLTIGLLVRNLNEWMYQFGWLGAVDAAREQNINLICFPGGAIHSPEGFEAQANILYDLINAEHLDGLLALSGEHLLTLINQVLDLSKIEAGRITLNEKVFDLRQLLDDLQNMFSLKAHKKRLRLVFECADEVPRCIETDEIKLRQILINLLNNAVKFTTEGGITLRVKKLETG